MTYTDRDRVGLCWDCIHARIVPHPRGGMAYWICAGTYQGLPLPKYPPLPVRHCPGYTPKPDQTSA